MFRAAWIATKAFFGGISAGTWIRIAVAAAIALAVWLAYSWAYERGASSRDEEVATLTRERDEARTDLEAAKEANTTNQVTIADLKAANEKWAESAKTKQEDAARAVARLESDRARLRSELAAARTARDAIYQGDEHAKSWAEAAVPRAVVDSLLRRAAAADRADGNGGRVDAGVPHAARSDDDGRAHAGGPADAVPRPHHNRADVVHARAGGLDRRTDRLGTGTG